MNFAQAQTSWLVLFSAVLLGAVAVGMIGVSGGETTTAAEVAANVVEVQDARFEFLAWGTLGALIAMCSMLWLQRIPKASRKPSHTAEAERVSQH